MCQVSILIKFQLSGIKQSLTSFHLTGNIPVQKLNMIVTYAGVSKILRAMTHAVVSARKAMNFMFWSFMGGPHLSPNFFLLAVFPSNISS